ncbi:helix-turn-helix domain-containing protein [Martelella mangrovi]|uniref:Transcriptional regulator with XRE-family HTH domain n=1 Tax=Martelella mangrovi TaxID=1397477 RepID=A0ABV2IE02_9HYPH
MLCVVENVRQKHLDWVRFILGHKRWSQTRLAKEAGLDPSTLSRFLKDEPDNTRMLNSYSIENIERVSGIPAFETSLPVLPRGLGEKESEPFDAEPLSSVSGAVAAIKQGRNGVDPWVLRSRCLETAGYMPGDIVIIDLGATPRPGDVVCAQVYDNSGRAETVMRIFEYPFLVAASMDARLFKPLLVDNERVVVRGVVIASIRERAAA